ncbi:S8 family serine peptidase [Calidithermus chliarophilus]|uniref:S8 family serine peptidase n=1 Tax=Calidithermus chliarophilus TaxID=52023 RepID=UPI0004092684|nr:S8 family serine peptidase [Calidithermus chliarophilus]
MQVGRFARAVISVSFLLLAACSGGGGGSGDGGGATTIEASSEHLSFPGTSSAALSVAADGSWTAQSDQGWLRVSPASGSGDATVTLTVDRSGLTPGHYAGTVLFKGGSAREAVTVYMRFPGVAGNITGPAGQVRPGSLGARPPAPEPGTYVPGEVLVALEPGMVAAEQGVALQSARSLPRVSLRAMRETASGLAADHGLSLAEALSPELPVFKLSTGGKAVGEVLEALRRDGRVRAAEPNYLHRKLAAPNDPSYPSQWHYGKVRLPQAWDLTRGSGDVVVAVIDGAVDTGHPDLAANLVPGYDFVANTPSITTPADAHGTHVAGTVAAVTDNARGVAGAGWGTKVMPLNVFPTGGGATDMDVNRAILFAAGFCVYNRSSALVCPQAKARVINLSLGPSNPSCVSIPSSEARKDAIASALGNGVVIVAAAGNDDCNVINGPAGEPGVIALSATGPADVITPYSDYGPKVWVAAPGGDQAGYGAAGGVYSTLPGNAYGYLQGTSMASPHVAGVAALVLAANPDLTPTQVRYLLASTASDLGAAGWDQYYGYGLVNAEAAVKAARDLLSAYFSDFRVRLRQGNTLVAEGRADRGGNFALENVPAGRYTLEAGNDRDHDGVLGEPGEFYGSTAVDLDYGGDVSGVGLNVQPR